MKIEKLAGTSDAWKDYRYWQQHNSKIVARINRLITDIRNTPFNGIGKPEVLQGDLLGFWSRRIDTTHRLIYAIDGSVLTIISCRYHYT